MLKSHTNKWVTHKLEGIYTPQRVSHRSESSEPPVRLSPGVQHQVDEPPEHLALRARRPPGLRKTEASLLRGCKQSFTQEQLFVKSMDQACLWVLEISWRGGGELAVAPSRNTDVGGSHVWELLPARILDCRST